MKVLLFGPAGAGKTSLMRTACQGYNFMKVANLPPTKGISRENFIFRGLMEINVWDAGGQERYLKDYFSDAKRDFVFSEVTTPVFMVDASASEPEVKDVFAKFVSYILKFSPHVENIYVLLNKIDLHDSKEDEVLSILLEGIGEDIEEKLEVTPVSVKEGSAQHRLIEILDTEIQKSTLSLQRLGKIRHLMDKLKRNTLADYFLFNRPDGLLITSTLGKFQSEPLEFMKLELSSLDLNIYQIYRKIMDLKKSCDVTPLQLSIIVYESDNSYIIIKELVNEAVIMAATDNKQEEVYFDVMKVFNSPEFKELEKIFTNGDYHFSM
mgnify:CR=1 FL=1